MPIYKQESGDDNNIILNLTSACSCRWRLIDYLRARQPGATAADAQDVRRSSGIIGSRYARTKKFAINR